ncbi:hypothetical protein SAMN04488061_2909 [Filomicrobium insigne]|uniref:Uncharacterized protein n=1 Tax=Filomicrobium insigne TaxID=418854 RepID=A0A1H0SIC5_9HYPH|nr:hypothetical protein [Filomicrobium insigne]SDP41504.1 hypothetical protein SAMN04488061_2909 [Filomicrobium insigne]
MGRKRLVNHVETPAPTEMTAREKLADLAKRRRENEFLVPPPIPLSVLNRARARRPYSHILGPPPEEHANNKLLEHMQQWLRDIADAGGFISDLRKAWGAWQPQLGAVNAKHQMFNHLDKLERDARRRECDLRNEAEWERKRDPQTKAEAKAAADRIRQQYIARAEKVMEAARQGHWIGDRA